MNKRAFPLFVFAAALLLSACGLIGSNSEFARQHTVWEDQAVGHYRYSVTIQCFCLFANIPVTYEVLDGEVVNVSINSEVDLGGATLEEAASTTQNLDTVEKLFAYVESALKEADKVEVTYDETFGFPSRVSVDWIEMAIDDEFTFFVTGFAPLP
jgi:hypothetical protein